MPAGWKAPPTATQTATVLGPERIVWHNELTKGIFHKHVVDTQRITNYRVIHNNSEILLKDVDDIVVMNQHRVSQSSYMGTSTARYACFGYGTSRSTGISVGDVVFMYQGRPYIIFKQITDPNGVARLVKSTRKQLVSAVKAAEKLQSQSQKQLSRITTTTTTKRNTAENVSIDYDNVVANCPRCSGSNPKGARYCNNCGFRIDNKITEMDTGQSIDSSTPEPTTTTTNATRVIKGAGYENELRYISNLYKIKMDYPVGWTKVEEGLSKPLVVGFTSPKEDMHDPFLETVGIGIVQIPKQINLDQYVQLNLNDLKNKNPDMKIQESSQTILCDVPAQRIVYENQGKTYLWISLIRSNESSSNNAAYMIWYVAEAAKYAIYLPIAQKMIDSFGFADRSGAVKL
jgi:hypothetical protein